jgi:predicted amidohydrolase YtcJ
MKKNFYFLVLAVLLICFAGYVLIQKDFNRQKSEIFYNGDILTLVDETNPVEAVYVVDGIIKNLGSNKEIFSLQTSSTKITDLAGKTLMPGFIDSHTHPALTAFLYNMVDLSGFTHSSEKELWDHLSQTINQKELGEWIICKGFDPILIPGLQSPHISFLDSISPNNPLVIISQSLHSYWANSLAFELVNVDKFSADPSTSSFYEKDSLGELTGFIAEQEAFKAFQETILQEAGKDKIIQATQKLMKDYARNGNTTIVSAGLTIKDKKPLRLFEHLSAEKPRFFNQLISSLNYLPKREAFPRHFIYIRHDTPDLLPLSLQNGDDFYRIIGIKHWYDGSPYTGSMYLSEPYMDTDLTREGLRIALGYRGERLIEKEKLKDFISSYHSKGWQIAIHAQGDQSIQEVLRVYKDLSNEYDFQKARHRLEHCLLLPDSSLNQMKNLNITPSLHINHLYYYGQALKDEIIGAERALKILPAKSIAEKQIKFSFHADQPMFESDPFHLIQTAVLRKTKEGECLNESQRISIEQALKAMTIDAAWQIHMEDKIGSIKLGKYADFIILDKNPLNLPPDQLRDITVLETIVHGNRVEF